jgi:anti-sigma regulatory factor (Ser/Thr protein kinase)
MKRESWLPAAPESAARARAIVRDAAREEGLDGQAVWDLMLATSEAFSNAVLHGTPCRAGILVRVEAAAEQVSVEVHDCGRFDTEVNPAPLDATGGRGIPIIDAVVDHFEVVPNRDQTVVRFGKRTDSAANGDRGSAAYPDAQGLRL